jgi:hypothetical protein
MPRQLIWSPYPATYVEGKTRTGPGTFKALASVEVGRLEEVVHGLGMHAERPADTHGRKLAVVDQPVDRHLAHPHEARHFRDGEELSTRRLAIASSGITCRLTTRRIPRRWPVHRRHRNPINQARQLQRLPHRWRLSVLTRGE